MKVFWCLSFVFYFVTKFCVGFDIFDFDKGIECGTKFCKATEYCNGHAQVCKSCEQICEEKGGHNRDLNKCDAECQQYKKLKYLEALRANYTELKDQIAINHGNVTLEIKQLRYIVIALFCLIFFCFVIYVFLRCRRWKKKRNITLAWISEKLLHKKKSENHVNQSSVAVTNASGRMDLRLEIPDSSLQNGNFTPATASTTISSMRRPTEDSPLDYAYDNPALATTPSPNRPIRPHESQL